MIVQLHAEDSILPLESLLGREGITNNALLNVMVHVLYIFSICYSLTQSSCPKETQTMTTLITLSAIELNLFELTRYVSGVH